MKNDIDDLLNSVFGSRILRTGGGAGDEKAAKGPELTLGDGTAIRPAQPGSRQGAGSASRRAAPTRARSAGARQTDLPAMRSRASDAARELEALEKAVPKTGAALDEAIARQRAEIEALNRTALEDIRRIGRELDTPAVQQLAAPAPGAQEEAAPLPTTPAARGAAGLEGFAGLLEALEKAVIGQRAFLEKLVIALKRPYVMGHTGEAARNAFFVTGPADTGKHLALCAAARALQESGVFVCADIAWMDLSLYPTAAEEKLFLQDLYMALAARGDVVVFEHYEQCQPAFLSVLANLVQRGKSPLAGRYILQNGRLVEAAGALVANAVGALTPRGKYLVLLSEAPVARLADSFGAPFVSALGDVCETAALTQQELLAVARAEFEKLRARAQTALGFAVDAADAVFAQAAAGRPGGAQNVLAFFDRLYRALAQYKLEHDGARGAVRLDAAADGRLTAVIGGEEIPDVLALLPRAYSGELEAVKAELAGIVGLSGIKEYILSLEGNFAVQARRRAAGLKTASVSMHMIFTGNPGTGKTTIARLVSKYLKAIGVLSGGQLVEVTRADLVGRYVGHTAPLTTQVMRSALGGVLFIDEAYSLYRGKDDSFGLEAIDTLVKGMEDHRDDLIVILAGYSREMADFLTANSGLKSRFPNIIEFPDYTGEELLAIAKLQAKGKGYVLDGRCDANLLAYFNAVQLARARDAGNGRLARNKVEEAILNQAQRLAARPEADLSLLEPEDFELDDVQG